MVETRHVSTVHNGQLFPTRDRTDGEGSWELVAAAQRGDREAFGLLYGEYVGLVSRFVGGKVPDRGLAEDLTSETFLRALRRIDSVSDQGRDVGAWFTTIAHNLVLDHLKSSRHRLETTAAEIPEPAGTSLVRGPEDTVIQKDAAVRLWRQVDQLPSDQRECLRLRFGQDLSTAQTAAVMGRSELAIRALRHRAVAGLREAMSASSSTAAAVRQPDEADPLVRARQAVTVAHQRATAEHRSEGEAQQRRVAHWRSEDVERDGLDVCEGVA
jgi:RNA polymerase sigma-70 factor, ECF subfamily